MSASSVGLILSRGFSELCTVELAEGRTAGCGTALITGVN